MANIDKFHEWVESQSPLALREYIHAQAAWKARGELEDAVRIKLEAELAEWKEVGLGHDENARQANEIIKTQHWLCLDGQMVVAQLYNLVEILNDPMRAYPHNFSTPAKGNALLLGLCQEAADEIERLKAETQEPVGYVDEFGNFEFAMQMWMEEEPNVIWTPVYTTPTSREWVGLSDDEIEEAVNYLNVKIDYPIMFARLIEMHLKEKNR